jgi:nucleoside-diphosphate-sugar epimerase
MPSDRPLVLVTGSEGFIGDAVVQALSAEYRVAGFDVARPHKDPQRLDFIHCDLTKDHSVQDALEKLRQREGGRIASVVHLAAYYDFSGDPSPLYKELTIEGTRRLLRGLQSFDVEQFIFSSTHILMKPSEDGEPVSEATPPEPTWAYPQSKLETERLIQREHGRIPAVVLRIAGVYNEDGHTVPIAQQIDRIAHKEIESFFFPGDPDSGQAYVHLEDLVDLIRRVIERRGQLPRYEVFLIAEPDKLSYNELQDIIGEVVHGVEWPTIRIPKVVAKAGAWVQQKLQGEEETFIRPWMVDRADDDYPVSIDHARAALGWAPRHRLRDTLPEIVARMNRDPERWRKLNDLPARDQEHEPASK